MKLHIVQFAAFASNLPFRRTKYFSQHFFSVTPSDVHKCQYEEKPVTAADFISENGSNPWHQVLRAVWE
jgi:hypothetical protein